MTVPHHLRCRVPRERLCNFSAESQGSRVSYTSALPSGILLVQISLVYSLISCGHDGVLPSIRRKKRKAEKMSNHRASLAHSKAEDLEAQHDDATYEDNEKEASQNIDQEGEKDPNIVDWDGPDDIENPRTWTNKAKTANISLVIVLTLLTPLASSMFAPGVPAVLRDFEDSSTSIAEFVVSICTYTKGHKTASLSLVILLTLNPLFSDILGFAVGPLLISPLSEIYGRFPIYVVCNIMFIIFTIACAVAGSVTQLIVFRFFAGTFGVCPVTLGGASIADLIPQEKRGISMSLFSVGPLLGPVIGPIAGGYLAAAEGWRWTFWVIAIAVSMAT